MHQRELNLRFADDDCLTTVHEFVHEFSWKVDLITPRNYKMDGAPLRSVTDAHRRNWIRSAANARRRALDLANGLGVIGDPEDTVPLDAQPKAGDNDDRRQPLGRTTFV